MSAEGVNEGLRNGERVQKVATLFVWPYSCTIEAELDEEGHVEAFRALCVNEMSPYGTTRFIPPARFMTCDWRKIANVEHSYRAFKVDVDVGKLIDTLKKGFEKSLREKGARVREEEVKELSEFSALKILEMEAKAAKAPATIVYLDRKIENLPALVRKGDEQYLLFEYEGTHQSLPTHVAKALAEACQIVTWGLKHGYDEADKVLLQIKTPWETINVKSVEVGAPSLEELERRLDELHAKRLAEYKGYRR